ncbi:hypothetical protein RXV86_01550 [Alisedimentitalea sp. MJ-SS2]|uniref:hypothetical protein n=1 Tax=Aliisedimentitalea sp. MJ-SS2 TaxID=3049795 RepID=UPI0029089579|nr:hypothetical protein [Alisedimentitalea sp. MJ-SS2]MDU8926061.1 hypothetical protein [Alisedimentitalea sp. MJ-SS2]
MKFKILRHALSTLQHDLGATLRILVVPYALSQVVFFLPLFLLVSSASRPSLLTPDRQGALAEAGPWMTFVLIFVSGMVLAWAAVAWHRYVLRNDRSTPGGQAFEKGRMIGYFGRTLLIGFLIVFVMAIFMMLVMAVGFAEILKPFGSNPAEPSFSTLIWAIALGILVTYLSTRHSLILPARALDETMSLSQSWRETASARADILGFAVILILLQNLTPLLPLAGLAAFVMLNLASLIGIALGIAMLTSLYGHLIEGRSFD